MESKSLFRLERTQAPGREKFKSLGVAMTSDSGGGGCPEIGGDINDPRSARGYTCILSRESRPAQRERNCEKLLTETAAVITHCVSSSRWEGPHGGISKTRSIGQLSVCLKKCRSQSIVWCSITIILYMVEGVKPYCKNSIKVERAEAGKRKGPKSKICVLRMVSQR